jgi:hypothetical protein
VADVDVDAPPKKDIGLVYRPTGLGWSASKVVVVKGVHHNPWLCKSFLSILGKLVFKLYYVMSSRLYVDKKNTKAHYNPPSPSSTTIGDWTLRKY